MTVPDRLLLEKLKQGDEMAYKHLFTAHYAFLSKIAYGFLCDDFSAQSVVDDVLFAFWEKRETIEISTSLRAYLVRSVKNRCLNLLNESRTQKEVCFSTLGDEFTQTYFESTADANPATPLALEELQAAIDQSLSSLSPESRCVFEASRWEGLSYDEIAAAHSISVNTVKYHIKQALAKLKKDLSPFLLLILFFNSLP